MGATFRKLTGRMNKAERRAFRRHQAEVEWLADIEAYRQKLEEDARLERRRVQLEEEKLRENEEKRRQKAAEEKRVQDELMERQRIISEEAERVAKEKRDQLQRQREQEEKVRTENEVKEELKIMFKSQSSADLLISELSSSGNSNAAEIVIQKLYLERYYKNKTQSMIARVGNVERFNELRMLAKYEDKLKSLAEEAKARTQGPESDNLEKLNIDKRRIFHHHHRDGSVSVKPTCRKSRRHHRKKHRILDDPCGDINTVIPTSPPSITHVNRNSSDTDYNNVKVYHIGGRIAAIPYHSMLDGE